MFLSHSSFVFFFITCHFKVSENLMFKNFNLHFVLFNSYSDEVGLPVDIIRQLGSLCGVTVVVTVFCSRKECVTVRNNK